MLQGTYKKKTKCKYNKTKTLELLILYLYTSYLNNYLPTIKSYKR